jgi:hypothetical protein
MLRADTVPATSCRPKVNVHCLGPQILFMASSPDSSNLSDDLTELPRYTLR